MSLTPIFELLPALASRVPRGALDFEFVVDGCMLVGVANVDPERARGWMFAGGHLQDADATPGAFLAGLRIRTTEEAVIVMTRPGGRFSFLEKLTSLYDDPLPAARAALAEALWRWDAGESVSYVHGFQPAGRAG